MNESWERVLAERAGRIARPIDSEGDDPIAYVVTLVGIGGQRIGIPLSEIDCVVEVPPLAPMPGQPAWVKGVVAVRGAPMSLLDLNDLLPQQGERGGKFALVIVSEEQRLALLVDEVEGQRSVYRSELVERDDYQKSDSLFIAATDQGEKILSSARLFRRRGEERANKT